MFEKMTIENYIDLLASDSPAPGGGSSLAIVAVNAVALVEMATNVTLTKLAKNGETNEKLCEIKNILPSTHTTLLKLSNEDAKAFETIISAMKLPKNSDEEKTTRTNALQSAYVASANVPLSLMEECKKAIALANVVIENADKFVVSDAIIGKNLLGEVIKNSVHNVKANTSCIKDEQTKTALENKMNVLLENI